MGWIELGVDLEGANICGHVSNVAYDPCTNGPQTSGVSTNVVHMHLRTIATINHRHVISLCMILKLSQDDDKSLNIYKEP